MNWTPLADRGPLRCAPTSGNHQVYGHGINPPRIAQAILSFLPSATCAHAVGERRERSTGVLGIGALPRPLGRGFAGNQGNPRASQRVCLHSGRWTSIVTERRGISPLLHARRESLDKLACRACDT